MDPLAQFNSYPAIEPQIAAFPKGSNRNNSFSLNPS